jgi:hypothetical protein
VTVPIENIDQWKVAAISYFSSGEAPGSHWDELAECLLKASENGDLSEALDAEIESHWENRK